MRAEASLTPINYLAYVLGAENQRKELGLAPGAAVTTVRWLCMRDDLRASLLEDARAFIADNGIRGTSLAHFLPGYDAWRADELAQDRARDQDLGDGRGGLRPETKEEIGALDE